VAELAEVVRPPGAGEQPREEFVDRAVVEHAGRDRTCDRRQRAHHPATEGIARVLHQRVPREAGKRGGAAAELAERGPEEDLGLERGFGAVVDEQAVHLRRRDAVRERGGDESPRRHADIGVEVVEIEAFERVG